MMDSLFVHPPVGATAYGGVCFECLVVSEEGAVTSSSGDPSPGVHGGTWPSTERETEELLAILREKDQLLEQMRSQCNVARRELDNLQRHRQQQVGEYEQRLNESRIRCERLQREVDALVSKAENAGVASLVDSTPPTSTASSTEREGDELPATGCRVDLCHVFTRIRERSQERRRVIDPPSSATSDKSTFSVCDP